MQLIAVVCFVQMPLECGPEPPGSRYPKQIMLTADSSMQSTPTHDCCCSVYNKQSSHHNRQASAVALHVPCMCAATLLISSCQPPPQLAISHITTLEDITSAAVAAITSSATSTTVPSTAAPTFSTAAPSTTTAAVPSTTSKAPTTTGKPVQWHWIFSACVLQPPSAAAVSHHHSCPYHISGGHSLLQL